MMIPKSRWWRGVIGGLAMGAAALTASAVDSAELGLEPVYPHLNPDRTQLLSETEIETALAELPGWVAQEGILYKVFVAGTFQDAVAMIVRMSYSLEELDHHPEIRNIYGKVYVGFTTYDQGKQITALDVKAALAVEAAVAGKRAKAGGHH
ncbi:4a-hydroxytetrahydrobiopterin dehydratase [Actomonas aquatica]|uniref:4a-hydroxytetrahydrobiopterin dehydratase n=1 Tax=Actomonas aquatica TaxID=2866162 RepID=A0ABZ1CBP9_9BACT|nr:4a-hydroxytetrahydrobiopterin dehydratase [Opitutus sp. WL0086]WRQ88876.1 4a-hydroxytetrahydrobiopterin dehydratase [Opitutus sp. WL0086]